MYKSSLPPFVYGAKSSSSAEKSKAKGVGRRESQDSSKEEECQSKTKNNTNLHIIISLFFRTRIILYCRHFKSLPHNKLMLNETSFDFFH